MCLTKDVVPLDTPLTKAPGPRVRPSYGRRKKSDTPLPMLRTRLAGLPRISNDPTTHPETKKKHLLFINYILQNCEAKATAIIANIKSEFPVFQGQNLVKERELFKFTKM